MARPGPVATAERTRVVAAPEVAAGEPDVQATGPAQRAWRRFRQLPGAVEAAVWITLAFLVILAALNAHGKDDTETVASGASTTSTQVAPTTTIATTETKAAPESAPPAAPAGGTDAGPPVASGSSTPAPAGAAPAAASPQPVAATPAPTTPAAPTNTTAAPAASTSETAPPKSPGEWALPAVPYHSQLVVLFDSISSAASKQDLPTVQAKAGELVQVAGNLRSALESEGPPPPAIGGEGRAVIAAASELERTGRAVASCTGATDCTTALKNLNTAALSYLNAVQALQSKISAGG